MDHSEIFVYIRWLGLLFTLLWFACISLIPFFVLEIQLPYTVWEVALLCAQSLFTVGCGLIFHPCPCSLYASSSHVIIFGTLFSDIYAAVRRNWIVELTVWCGSLPVSAFAFYIFLSSCADAFRRRQQQVFSPDVLPPVGRPITPSSVVANTSIPYEENVHQV